MFLQQKPASKTLFLQYLYGYQIFFLHRDKVFDFLYNFISTFKSIIRRDFNQFRLDILCGCESPGFDESQCIQILCHLDFGFDELYLFFLLLKVFLYLFLFLYTYDDIIDKN